VTTMTKIPIDEVQNWVKKYGNTKRQIFLHPYMLEYELHTGSLFCPSSDPIYNIDTPFVTEIKYNYFISQTFTALSHQDRVAKMEEFGLCHELRMKLAVLPRFKKLLTEVQG
jgi:hypothetical protein